MDYVVITGGPGAGKSTLIDRLEDKGFVCVPECGRAIIQDQWAIGGRGLPWESVELFAELMLSWDLRAYREAGAAGPVFFDRGIVDTIGYLRLEGKTVPAHFTEAARRYRYREVFIAPFWPEIYTLDDERTQTPREARMTHDAILAAYRDFGYRPVALPLTGVGERAEFVLRRVSPVTAPPSGRMGSTRRAPRC